MKWIIITAALLAALGIFTIFTVGVAYTIAEKYQTDWRTEMSIVEIKEEYNRNEEGSQWGHVQDGRISVKKDAGKRADQQGRTGKNQDFEYWDFLPGTGGSISVKTLDIIEIVW
jgi:hypothetical protein